MFKDIEIILLGNIYNQNILKSVLCFFACLFVLALEQYLANAFTCDRTILILHSQNVAAKKESSGGDSNFNP